MLEPGLEIARRCFDHESRLESGREHPIQRLTFEVVHHGEVVLAMRSNVYVPALEVLKLHPGDRAHEAIPVPRSRNHLWAFSIMSNFRLEQSYFENASS